MLDSSNRCPGPLQCLVSTLHEDALFQVQGLSGQGQHNIRQKPLKPDRKFSEGKAGEEGCPTARHPRRCAAASVAAPVSAVSGAGSGRMYTKVKPRHP